MNQTVTRWNQQGQLTLTIGYNFAQQSAYPNGVAVDSQNNIWVADSNGNSIIQFSPTGQYIQQLTQAGSVGVVGPRSLYIDANGNLFAALSGTQAIAQFIGVARPGSLGSSGLPSSGSSGGGSPSSTPNPLPSSSSSSSSLSGGQIAGITVGVVVGVLLIVVVIGLLLASRRSSKKPAVETGAVGTYREQASEIRNTDQSEIRPTDPVEGEGVEMA